MCGWLETPKISRPEGDALDLRDSRRLTGPNILWDRPGAVLDVVLEPTDDGVAAVEAWRRHAKEVLEAIGWTREETVARRFHGGVSLALSAPVDALYAATEVNEWAWEAAAAELCGDPPPDLGKAAERLRQEIRDEANPRLLALQAAAVERGVMFLSDDDEVSVGLGSGSRTWPVHGLPAPEEVPWSAVHDIPVALVTGTNGKTTTVGLLAAMVTAAGKVAGFSSTEGVWAGGEILDRGDYAGPGGGRRVLRDRRVEVAILETARGGMLRRGLALPAADVAVITNVAEDHLGEWGIHDLGELAETKLVVARAARRLVVNGEDSELRNRLAATGRPVTWFSLDPARPEAVSNACILEGRDLVVRADGEELLRVPVKEVPCALGGAARHNVANALAALAAAGALGLSLESQRRGLALFSGSAEENPGRLNVFELGGVTALVDFAHNPHGMAALMRTARSLQPRRLLVLLGQAGDRDDHALAGLAQAVWKGAPDRVILKELPGDLRGRCAGEVPRILAEELRRLGAPPSVLSFASSEIEAVREALTWAAAGDLLLLVSHADRPAVLELLQRLRRQGWRPGEGV